MAIPPLKSSDCKPLKIVNIHFENRVLLACRKAFETLKLVFTFPLRFLGSKTWSIPGVILRLPGILFRRIFGKPTLSLKEELFGSGYRFQFEKKLTPAELKPYLAYACGSSFAHTTNQNYILPGWKALSTASLDCQLEGIQKNEFCFFDPQTDLKISFLEKGDELIISFGALGSLESIVPNRPRHQKWKNIIRSFIGVKPDVYEQANSLVETLLTNPYFKNKKLTLVGQSFGASIASYTALKNKLPAICFNSFPLGIGLQQELGTERLRDASQYITHIFSDQGGIINATSGRVFDAFLNTSGIRTPGSFGRLFRIPSIYLNPADCHAYILSSIMKYLGYDERTKPIDLKPENI